MYVALQVCDGMLTLSYIEMFLYTAQLAYVLCYIWIIVVYAWITCYVYIDIILIPFSFALSVIKDNSESKLVEFNL